MTKQAPKIDSSIDPRVIRAAGGIVWKGPRQQRRLAIVHRPKYDDWSLPKGKLEPGESWQQAAIREVREEAGCLVRVTGFAGLTSYLVDGRPKVVLFWNMEQMGPDGFRPGNEVDRLLWVSREEALARLDHPAERRLLENHGPVETCARPAGSLAE